MDWDRPNQYQLKKKSAAYLEYGVGLGHLGITQVWFVDGACRLGSCHIFSQLLFGCIMFASSNFAFFCIFWCSPTRQQSFTDRNPVSKRLWLECLSLALMHSSACHESRRVNRAAWKDQIWDSRTSISFRAFLRCLRNPVMAKALVSFELISGCLEGIGPPK